MDKKRKGQDNNSASINENKRKKNKKVKDVTTEDVIENVNENNETDLQSKVNKKRKNKNNKEVITDVVRNINVSTETDTQSTSKKKRKDRKNKDEIPEDLVENQDKKNNLQVSSNKKRKSKKNKEEVAEDNSDSVIMDSNNPVQCTNSLREIRHSEAPKKIIFVDDEPQEVSITGSDKTKKSKPFKKAKEQNDILNEEDVKDEDIDKFCDELGEEDNKQYEDWVQLIEATLSSNKKKSK